jgi:hypothetical protein
MQTRTARLPKAELDWWCGWAARSRLSPFRNLAKTVRQHWDGILAYFDTHLTPAAIEAVNGIIQFEKNGSFLQFSVTTNAAKEPSQLPWQVPRRLAVLRTKSNLDWTPPLLAARTCTAP